MLGFAEHPWRHPAALRAVGMTALRETCGLPPYDRGMLDTVRPIAEAIRARGGRAIAVGGFVRDSLLGRPESDAKDLGVEVFGLTAPELESVLRGFGEVLAFGRSLPVMRVVGFEVDFSLARGADFAEAARRRDLTIHAIGLDPLSGEILDPLGG